MAKLSGAASSEPTSIINNVPNLAIKDKNVTDLVLMVEQDSHSPSDRSPQDKKLNENSMEDDFKLA